VENEKNENLIIVH